MKKILIFHLFAFRGFTNNDFTKIHEICLKKYIHIFDESRFVVVVDNLVLQKIPAFLAMKKVVC